MILVGYQPFYKALRVSKWRDAEPTPPTLLAVQYFTLLENNE
jgi:hypothetical protein